MIYIVTKALIALSLWGAAVIGWMGRPLAIWERALAMIAAFTLVVAMPMTDQIGFALFAAFAAVLWFRRTQVQA